MKLFSYACATNMAASRPLCKLRATPLNGTRSIRQIHHKFQSHLLPFLTIVQTCVNKNKVCKSRSKFATNSPQHQITTVPLNNKLHNTTLTVPSSSWFWKGGQEKLWENITGKELDKVWLISQSHPSKNWKVVTIVCIWWVTFRPFQFKEKKCELVLVRSLITTWNCFEGCGWDGP